MAKKTGYLRVSGRLYPDNRLILRPSYLSENPRDSVDEKESPLKIELYGTQGLLLRWGARLTRPLRDLSPGAREAPEFLSVRAKVPYHPDTREIVFLHNDIELLRIQVPKHKPSFAGKIKTEKKGDDYIIQWKTTHPEKVKTYYHVRMSADRGKTWARLASRLAKPRVRVKRDSLSGGKNCLIEVVAYDGVNTVSARTKVPDAPPVRLNVEILSPLPSKTPAIPPIELHAYAAVRGRGGRLAQGIEYVWTANDEKIATGPNGIWIAPRPGKYKIIVHAHFGKLTGEAMTTIRVGGKEHKAKA